MMDEENLHNDLSRRISEVFDNYEDTTADEGWALLRQKYPPEKKNRGLAWLWYAAAAVVLLCLGVWMLQKTDQPKQLVVKQDKPTLKINPQTQVAPVTGMDTTNQLTAVNHTPNSQQPPTALPATGAKKPAATAPTVTTLAAAKGQQTQSSTGVNSPTGTAATGNVPNGFNAPAIAATEKSQGKGQTIVPAAGSINPQITGTQNTLNPILATTGKPKLPAGADSINKRQALADAATKNSVAKTNPATAQTGNPAKTADSIKKAATQYAASMAAVQAAKTANEKAFNSLFESKNAPALKEEKTVMKGSKKAMFSVYAATYFNYAKGSDNQMNVGAGFSSDFKISNRLKLSTGVSVGQNSLSYAANTPQRSDNFVSAQTVAPATNFSSANLVAAAAKTNIPSKYNASLVGLDIPVNLKYQFTRQSDTYVAAGLSSGTFINETYQSVYSNAANTVTSVENTSHASFNNFDFAKTLNVSFGMGYPLGKSNRLIVEPFLKYPLDGLGSQQLKFGAGGINLKLNFQTLKK